MVQSFEAPPAAGADGRPTNSRGGDRDAAEPEPWTGTPPKVLPRTPEERGIAEIWSAALDREGIGVHDDFFELDGDSLTAIKVITRIREAWGVGIPPAVFFESPTVATLALAVVQGAPAQRPVVGRRPPDAEPVLSFDQQRLWLEHHLRPEAAYNVHAVLSLTGPLDVEALNRSLRTILVRHETLRTRFPTEDGRPVQVVEQLDDAWRIGTEDLTAVPGDRLGAGLRLAAQDAQNPFDLANGPVFRCTLIRLGNDDHLLSICAHHIVCDDWSAALFMRELSALYRVGGDADRADLPHLPVQYQDFAAWQRRWLTGDSLAEQVEYWREHLIGAPPALALPTRRWRPAAEPPPARLLQAVLDRQDTLRLHDLCQAHRATPFMVLLAGLGTVLARWTGQPDVVVGVPITGRTDVGTENLIGFFINTMPMRVRLSGRPSFAELLDRVRASALDGYEHAEAPFDVIVRQLPVMRVPGRTPVFQVALNVLDVFDRKPIEGLATELVPAQLPPSKFDLSLNAREYNGQLHLDLEYDADRYPDEMIAALLDQLCALLRSAIGDPYRDLFDHLPPAPEGIGAPSIAAPSLSRDDRVAILSKRPGLVAAAMTAARDAGAQLVRPDDDMLLGDVTALCDWLRDKGITVVYLDPPILRAISGPADAPRLPALRVGFVDNAGDLLAHDVQSARRWSATCQWVGLYRVGEDGVPLATHPVPDDWKPDTAPLRVPLGCEPAGGPLRLRRPTGQAAAVGEVAEVWAGDQPTGDLARRWHDGTLEFVGRSGHDDGSVVDPVIAIEAVGTLRDIPGVRDALVTEHPTDDGRTVLLAYVAGPDPAEGASLIRRHLVNRLPDHQLPHHLFVLDELPRTLDGGYDLSVLPQPDADSVGLDDYVAPRTTMERQLVGLLHELLDVDRIGVHDSFFELGGFSLLATRLSARVRDTFSVEITLRDLFTSASVDQLAQLIVQEQAQLAGMTDLERLLDELTP